MIKTKACQRCLVRTAKTSSIWHVSESGLELRTKVIVLYVRITSSDEKEKTREI
jgi:hypothetical protein